MLGGATLYMSWHLAVFLAEILFLYPDVSHVMRTLYHRVVSPLTVRKSPLQDKLPPVGTSPTLRILWSCTGELDSLSRFYEPNYIVPVVKIGASAAWERPLATRTTPAVVPKAKHTKLNKISTFFKSLPRILSLIGLQFSHGSN